MAVRFPPPLTLFACCIWTALALDTEPAPLPSLPSMPGPFAPGRPITFTRDGRHPARAEPQPHGQNPQNAASANASCEHCHTEIAAEWRSSLHRSAHTEPAFQRAFSREPMPFCQGCHAPEADPNTPVPSDISIIGVACVTCHLSGGHLLAAPSEQPQNAPHSITRDARFAQAAACANCHEFNFPRPVPRPDEPMQLTIREHQSSPFASLSCADCHMPKVNGHKSHSFSASRDPELIRSAVQIQAARTSPQIVQIHLQSGHIGHAFPTGDLFRRVRIEATALGPDQSILARREHILARSFGEHRYGLFASRTQIGDTRLGTDGPSKTIELDLGTDAAMAPIHYRIAYERVEHPLSKDGRKAVIEGEIVLSEGIFEAPPPKPGPRLYPKRAQQKGTKR